MKLRAKINPEYLEQILTGSKDSEYRHIDKMILENSETGEEYMFEVIGIERVSKIAVGELQKKYPKVGFTKTRPCYQIGLGERLDR